MRDEVSVVLVPKSSEGQSIYDPSTDISPTSAKRVAPDPGRANEALKVTLGLNVQAHTTPRAAVNASFPHQRIQEIFGAELREAKRGLIHPDGSAGRST